MKDAPMDSSFSDTREINWVRLTQKKWQSSCGQFIIDFSFQVDGKKVGMYMVFRNQKELSDGNNYATGKTLIEVKKLATEDR